MSHVRDALGEISELIGSYYRLEHDATIDDANATIRRIDDIIHALGRLGKERSVLQDWVMRLPLREQGVLLTAVRNCDVSEKVPEVCSADRQLVAWIRWCFLNPADPREVDYAPCAWFQSQPPEFRMSLFGHFPLHWFGHVMHALQVIAVRHPDRSVATRAETLYRHLVHGLHLQPEAQSQMIARLSEDRIEKGTVIS